MRIDKFLWSVRLYKTRTLATAACKAGKITINDENVKASFECKIGNELTIKNGAFKNSYRILEFPSSRVAAKIVSKYILNITSSEDQKRNELMLLARKENALYEYGKPTKKDRRELKKFRE